MRRIILFFFIITSVVVTAQVQDSSSQEIKIYSDTLALKPDSLFVNDSLSTILQRDSVAPIYANALTEKSFIIKNSELLKLEYQYSGDYLRAFPLTFIKDLGFTGQPNETFLYGVGNNSISFLLDGVSYNDRYLNSLNLNLIQSEDVDSIEIIPLPRGFLYGAYNNPVSVNFITKDFVQAQPYTRIRFYQGADRDMMFDGSFNAMVLNKLIASFDVTNRIFDGTYANSDYSIWQGKIKLKYLLSNDVNIIASYNYNDYNAGYNGGVNVDSIAARGGDIDKTLHNPTEKPPLFYPSGELKTLTHLPKLRFLIKPMANLNSDFSVFYLFKDYQRITNTKQFTEDKAFGVNAKNDFSDTLFNVQLNANYEKGKFNRWEQWMPDSLIYYSNIPETDYDLFYLSGYVSLKLFDGDLIPSVFGKYSYYNTSSGSRGFTYYNHFSSGIDITYKASKFFDIYFGYSKFLPYTLSDINYTLIEAALNFHLEGFKTGIRYFKNDYLSLNSFTGFWGNLSGLALSFDFKYSSFLIQSNLATYIPNEGDHLFGVPNFQTQTGLYFKDILFNNNLDLKTGFVFYYTGKNNVFTYEKGLIEVPSSNKLDFTLAGEIQKTAIVYFLWQNLLGNDYYITPYYPMPSRSIRFGVAWEMFN